jgi:ribosomal protein L7Ae-like RNA K-turn-binding protein
MEMKPPLSPRKAMTSLPTEPDTRDDGSRAESEALRLLGLVRRAGSVVAGTEAVKEAARAGSLAAVVFAADASNNARRRIEPLLDRQAVRSASCGDRGTLGAAIGKGPIAVIGITDEMLARTVLNRLGASRR